MDPISLVAIAGILYAGKTLSDRPSKPPAPPAPGVVAHQQGAQPLFAQQMPVNQAPLAMGAEPTFDMMTGAYIPAGTGFMQKQAVGSFADVSPTSGRNPHGQPVYNYANRQDVSGKMNSVQPVEKQQIGPGLGLAASQLPAYGGFQQMYRVMPNNVNGYKLNTLPGRSGPAMSTVPKATLASKVTHGKPEKTAYLFERYPAVRGRAEGQGGNLTGMTGHQNFERTKRQTNRSVTTMRDDGLSYGPANSIVSDLAVQDNPTRNKGDMNQQRVNTVAAPGIANFEGGYQIAPTDIRPAVNRGKKDREGNAGRMNVRADPLNAIGALTAVKDNASTVVSGVQGPTSSANQTYVQDEYYQFNAYKGNVDPNSCNLGLAAKQLAGNPLAHTLARP